MSKKKFSWDLFTDENENIVMKDTKDNEMIFLQMAEEQGIEVDWRDFNYSNDNCHCYYSFAFGNRICMSECKCHTDDEIYSLQEVIEGLKSNDIILEDGDIVQLRNRVICVIVNGFIIDFNKKEVMSKVEEYDLNLKDKNNIYFLDIVKVAKKDTLVPYNYIAPSEEYVEWTWKREVGIPSDLCNGTRIKVYDTETGEIYTGTITTLDIDEESVKILVTESGINKNTKCVLLKNLDLLEVLE